MNKCLFLLEDSSASSSNTLCLNVDSPNVSFPSSTNRWLLPLPFYVWNMQMKSFSSTACFSQISVLKKSSASVHCRRREFSPNPQLWQNISWHGTPPKDPISHQPDRKQIEIGSRSSEKTNDRQACKLIWHCLIGLFSLPVAHVPPVDKATLAHISSAFFCNIWWCAHCLKLL